MVSPLPSPSSLWPARLSWGAVIAGCVAALGIHLLLAMLGLSLGIALVNPTPGEEDWPELSAAAGVAWSVSALVALWIGGWIAGRTSRPGPGNAGGIHGLLVWCVATIVSFGIVTGGAGLVGAGVARLLRTGVTAAGPAADELLDLTRPAGLLSNFVEEVLPDPAGADGPGPNRAQVRRDLAGALQRLFTEERSEMEGEASAREALVRVLVDAGRPPAEAEAMVRRWEDAYARARQNAEAAANRAAKRLAVLASWTVAAFALGAFAAAWGGRSGAGRSARLLAAGDAGVPGT